MTGVCGFLKERENGSFRSTQYRKCHKHVKNWLERLSASPVLNQPCEFSGEPKATFLVDFSPGRTKIASAHGDHTVRVTEVATGKCTHILTGHPRTPWCLAFHPSHDDILASGCLGGQVRIWDLRGGGSEVFNSNSNSLIASLTFHPIDRVLVFSTKNRLYFWDWTQSEPFECCSTAYDFARVRWVKFDALGHYLYTGICNNTTVTRACVYEVGNRNERYNSLSGSLNWQQRHLNRQRYERLVNQVREAQQQRLLGSDASDRPTSPVHLDRLRQAYSYARYVTNTSRDSNNWIQMAQRRSHRGGATEGEEMLPSSPSRPSAARYSMFSVRPLRPQPGANSPPPRPLPDSDLQDQEAEQPRRPLLHVDQLDQAGRSGNAPVGTGRASSSRDQQQPDEDQGRRFLQFCHALRRRRDAGDDSREASTSSSSLTTERGSTETSTIPGESSNARRMRFDAQLIGSALQAHTLSSRREPSSGRRVRLDDQSMESSDARSALGGRRRRRTRLYTSYVYQSSDPSDLEQQRSNGEGDSAPIDSPSPVQLEEGRESGTGEAFMGSRGTLYNMLSRQGSGPSSAFSVPSRRSEAIPSVARTVPSILLPSPSVENTGSLTTSLSSSVQSSAGHTARQTLYFGVLPLPQSALPEISGNNGTGFDGQVSSAMPSFSSSAFSSSTSSPYISVWGNNAGLFTSSGTSHPSVITSSSSFSSSSTARNISVWGNSTRETSSADMGSSLTAFTCPSSSAETPDSSGLNSREGHAGLNSEAAHPSLNPEATSSSSVNSGTAAPSTSSATNKRSYLTAFGAFSSSSSLSQPGPQPSQTVSSVTSSTSSSASDTLSQSHPDAGGGSTQDSRQTDFPLPPSRQPRLSTREGTASSTPTSSSSSLPRTEPQPAYSPPLGEQEFIPGSVSCRYLTHWLTRVAGAADSSWPRSSVLVDVNRIRRLAFVSPTWSCDLVNPLNRSADSSDSSTGGQRCSICWCVPSTRPVGAYRQYITGRITDDLLRVRIRERTMDGTSQTQGQLNEPEHTDRGTDITGLAQFGQMDEVSTSFQTRTGGAQEVTTPDLERQLSENDDEISRIESSYREEMQRLADQRRRILSTMRESRPHTSSATVDCSNTLTACSSSSPAATDPSAQAGSSSAQGHAPSDLVVASGGGRAAGISCSTVPTTSATPTHSAASSWSTGVSCSAEARPVLGLQRTTPALSGASAQSSVLQAGSSNNSSSNSNNYAPASSPMEASGSAQQPETSSPPPVSSANSDGSLGAGAASRLSLTDSDDGSGSVSGAGLRCPAGPPLHTLPSATGSDNDRIEVLTGPSGESETISYSELARRLANREDVMVVGNHRLAPPSSTSSSFSSSSPSSSTPSASSSSSSSQILARSSQHRLAAAVERSAAGDGASVIGGGGGGDIGGDAAQTASALAEDRSLTTGRGRSHLLRTCLVNSTGSRPAPVPLPHSSAQSTITSAAAGRSAPPVILVQQPAPDDQSDGSNRENRGRSSGRDADWYGLEQRHLHPHYSRSILDDTINRPNDVVQSAINRAIAGVFMSSGEQAVASNIVPGTHRIQRWDFRNCDMPDLTQQKANIVVEHCKIHNDASIDMSRDSSLLATFVNNHGGFPDDNILAVFSLRSESFGQCLYTKSFGPNAISVSLSPSNQYVMVGLASKRTMWIQVTDQLVGQILKLNKPGAGEYSMVHVTDLYHPVRRMNPVMMRGVSPVSVNSARWLPDVGEGIVYGTNHGDLHFYRAGRTKAGLEEEEAKPRKLTISTQTGTGSIRRSAFTQTVDEETAN